MASSLTVKQWIIVILVNIVISLVTTLLVIRVIMTQPTDSEVVRPVVVAPTQVSGAPDATATARQAPAANATPLPSPTAAPAATPTSAPAASRTPTRATTSATTVVSQADAKVRISNALYIGQRQREVVVIVNEGPDISLKGWTLTSSRNITYTFPNVTLFEESFISVHTMTGADVPTDLFMNRTDAAWQAGDKLTLIREDQTVAEYTIR